MNPEHEIEHAATDLLEKKFLPQAESAESAKRIDAELDRKQVGLLAAALLYFISPLDLVPDIIPGLGYVDDLAVLAYVLKTVASTVRPMRDALIEHESSSVVEKGRTVLENVIDTRLAEFDRVAGHAVRRSIAVVAISLWGTTTAAAVSLAIVALTGKYQVEWAIYVVVATAFVGVWNAATALAYWREFRKLHGSTQARLITLVAWHTRLRDVAAIGVPIFILLGLMIARFALT
jgi:uncharacterized membrane protein YkvA (DUF1232 family)